MDCRFNLLEAAAVEPSLPPMGAAKMRITCTDHMRFACTSAQLQPAIRQNALNNPKLIHEVVVQLAMGRRRNVVGTRPGRSTVFELPVDHPIAGGKIREAHAISGPHQAPIGGADGRTIESKRHHLTIFKVCQDFRRLIDVNTKLKAFGRIVRRDGRRGDVVWHNAGWHPRVNYAYPNRGRLSASASRGDCRQSSGASPEYRLGVGADDSDVSNERWDILQRHLLDRSVDAKVTSPPRVARRS
jgi:hypothetical protein